MKEAIQKLRNLINEIMLKAGFNAEIEDLSSEKELRFNLKTQERLILNNFQEIITAFQELCRRFLSKENILSSGDDKFRIFFDIQGERQKRESKLKELAQAAAKKVRREKKSLELPPMNSFERRVIHFEISLFPDLTSESVDEGEDRRVVIKPVFETDLSAKDNQLNQENERA